MRVTYVKPSQLEIGKMRIKLGNAYYSITDLKAGACANLHVYVAGWEASFLSLEREDRVKVKVSDDWEPKPIQPSEEEERLQEAGRIGSMLHEVFCPFNDDGGCDWYYEDWSNPSSSYHWYLAKAEELAETSTHELQRLNRGAMKRVAAVLTCSVEWGDFWGPGDVEDKAEKLLSLVGNDKDRAVEVIREHKRSNAH